MKALSVKQPWADGIAQGGKNVEFRSKPTNYRGDLLICSSKTERGIFRDVGGVVLPVPVGVAMCTVKVVDCRPMCEADKKLMGAPSSIASWWVWVFADDEGETVEPVEVKGVLGLFEVPDELIRPIPEGRGWWDYNYPNKADKPPKDCVPFR